MKKIITLFLLSSLLLTNSAYANENIQSQIDQIDQEIEALKIKRQELVGQLDNSFTLEFVDYDLQITAEDVQLQDDILYIFWYVYNNTDDNVYLREYTDGKYSGGRAYQFMQVNPTKDQEIEAEYNPRDVAIGEYLSEGEFPDHERIAPGKEVRYYTTYPLQNTDDPVHIYLEYFNPYNKFEYVIDLNSLK